MVKSTFDGSLYGSLYNKESVRFFDHNMIENHIHSGYQLMTRAAQSVMDVINDHYPKLESLLIFCGQGNNAGDGYVIARLAQQQKIQVQLVNLADPERLKGDALTAYQDWLSDGGGITPLDSVDYNNNQLIVDALIGTGLDRHLNPQWLSVVNQINQSGLPIIAVDIPSGLDADTGAVWGGAVKADITVTFIALKQGLYTGQARDYCGNIIFKALGVPDEVYRQRPSTIALLSWSDQKIDLPRRSKSSHKGDHGKVLIIGGNQGMAGAARIAGESALRSGAGLVKIICHPNSCEQIANGRPELMVNPVETPENNHSQLQALLDWADSIAIGPGLGQDQWAKYLLRMVLKQRQRLVFDADALNLLADLSSSYYTFFNSQQIILTPHPAEAGRLLGCSTQEIEADRYTALQHLVKQYQATIVLKGAGTLIGTHASDTDNSVSTQNSFRIGVCPYGNPGMASGGMGDSLTGIMASLINQYPHAGKTAEIGVNLHAKAADIAAKEGEVGLLASDLLEPIRYLINA